MNDDEPQGIFISTQIQSRIEDLQEEQDLQIQSNAHTPLSRMFSLYANPNHDSQSSIHGEDCNKESNSAGDDFKKKTKTKTKTKTKPNKTTKKLSVTDLMVRKLSGKPAKFKRKKPSTSTKEDANEINDDENNDDDNEFSVLYDVINEDEWGKVDYRFLTFKKQDECCEGQEEEISDEDDLVVRNESKNLWNIANMIDDEIILEKKNSEKIKQIHEFEPPITLSQLMRVNDDDNIITLEGSDVQIIDCSSDSGSPIAMEPILIVSDSEEEPMTNRSRSLRVFGTDLKLSHDCVHNLRLIKMQRESSFISDSEDEELGEFLLQIKD